MLKKNLLILFFFFFAISVHALEINENTKFYNLLPHAKIFIDKSKSLKLQDILKIKNEFKKNDKKLLAYGYSPDFSVWIQFTLKNTTNKPLDKIIEYDNPLTTSIEFFSPSDAYVKKEGIYHIPKDKRTVNPIFKISLHPQESKTFYMRVSSHITTLIVKLNLYSHDSFYEKELKHQFILGLFFASILILGIYNLFIYFFTKDISYLYYVLYLVGVILHQMMYVGIANIYILNQECSIYLIEYAALLVAFPIFFLALFTKAFLDLKQYKLYNKILIIYLLVFPFLTAISIFTEEFSKYRNIFTLLLLIYLVVITVYATLKKNRQAYFILFGWFIILVAGTFMYISSLGIFDMHQYFPYIVEISFVSEAVVFSIALADRIKQLQIDKNDANNKLISQQKNEKERLEVKVTEKTIDLKHALDEKEMLLKELNHRVKNNMQTIVSLIRLQLDELDEYKDKEILTTTYNRINAMSHLHELLYYQTNISKVNAKDYFRLLTDEIQESYGQYIKLHLEITSDLELEQAIYCGLILNELTTNSFKHAFSLHSGNVYIKFSQTKTHYLLSVCDDGIGYDKSIASNSLGLVLVDNLVKSKLKGSINMFSNNGVEVIIKWEINHE